MNKIKAKLNNKINKKVNKQIRRVKRMVNRVTKNKVRRLKIKANKIIKRRRLPAAFTINFKRTFNILKQTGTSMRVKGKDLIYQIPDKLQSSLNTPIITMIPSNPAYWLGTRMSAISAGYQNYRPISFKVTYVPQCAVTQQGNVLGGTLWAMSPNKENLQQTLRTSNGGMLTQCYKTHSTIVKLGSNLQFNLFRMGGKLDQESNPFIFIALSIGTNDTNNNKIIPGYFYVEYEYELKNPIGNTINYYNSGLIKKGQYVGHYVNETCINCDESNGVNLGAIIQKDNNTYSWNEKDIDIPNDSILWYLSNDILTGEAEQIPVEIAPGNEEFMVQTGFIQINSNASAYYLVIDEKNNLMLYHFRNYQNGTNTPVQIDTDTFLPILVGSKAYEVNEELYNRLVIDYENLLLPRMEFNHINRFNVAISQVDFTIYVRVFKGKFTSNVDYEKP